MNICKLTLNVFRAICTTIINHTAGAAVCTTRNYEMCSDGSHLTLTNRCHVCAYISEEGSTNKPVCCEQVSSPIVFSRLFRMSAESEVTVQCCQKDYISVPQNCFVLGTGPR